MKYYSTDLDRLFDTEEELKLAEETAKREECERIEYEKEKLKVRSERKKQVIEADKIATEAIERRNKLIQDFYKDYHEIIYLGSEQDTAISKIWNYLFSI